MSYKCIDVKWILLILYSLAYIVSGFCISIQAPFYPKEAEQKGASPSEYGIVFGIYNLIMFFASPICGKLVPKLGASVLSTLGLFISGITSILFGFLDKINGTVAFIAFSLTIRMLEAAGTSAFKTGAFSIISQEFSHHIGTAFASLETSYGAGLIIGPTVGGALYEAKGFQFPFLLTGILLLCSTILILCFLPNFDEGSNVCIASEGYLLLLRQPEIILGIASAFGAFLNISFFHPVLEPHMRNFQLSPLQLGFMFIINGSAYSASAIFWGIVCDKWLPPQCVWSIGAILIFIAMLLIGPAPYLPFDLNVPICASALFIHGLGLSAQTVSAFYCFSKVALKLGFPDNVNTYGLISAIYNSSISLGGFFGPTLAGFLYNRIGLPWGVHVLAAFHISLVGLTSIYNFCVKDNKFPKPGKINLESDQKRLCDSNGNSNKNYESTKE